jgi:hypothetical protein
MMSSQKRSSSFRALAGPALLALVALPLLSSSAVLGQAPSPQDRMSAVKESLARNQAALKQYEWTETTQVAVKGETKKTELKRCYYGADGKVQKLPIPGPAPAQAQQSSPRRGGRVGQKIVENKIEDTKEYMEKVTALVHEYVPPDPSKIQTAQAGGKLSIEPSPATTTLTVKDYVKPGDSLAISMDPNAKQIRSYRVGSYVDDPKDDAVALNVTFASLPDGTNYPQQIVLNVAAKNIQVTVTNSGYKKTVPPAPR